MDVRLRRRVGSSDISRELFGGLVMMNPFMMYSIGRAEDPCYESPIFTWSSEDVSHIVKLEVVYIGEQYE